MELTEVITVFAIVATNLITVITLHIQLDNKTTPQQPPVPRAV